MMYLLNLLSFFIITGSLSGQTQQENNVATVFGKSGLDLAPQQVNLIKNLAHTIAQASVVELQMAAKQIVNQLELQLKKTEQQIVSLDAQGKQVSSDLFFERYILERRIDHFKNYFGLQEQTVLQWLTQQSQFVYHRLSALLRRESVVEERSRIIADEMVQYFEIEKHILMNYQRLLLFLELVKRYPIPHFLLVWDTPNEIENLKKRANQLKPEIKVQLLEMIVSFAIQGLLMGGGSAAIQIIDDTDREAYEIAKQKQNDIATAWGQFQKNLMENQTKLMSALSTAFTTSAQAVQAQYAKDQERLSTESIYLAQTINQAKPREQFLAAPSISIILDILFAGSKMLTPNPLLPWYNLYNIVQRGSDWEYNGTTNSFWQYGYAPFPAELYWKMDPADASLAQNDPAAFSIFTEYVTGKNSYDIEVDCVLSTSTYPFFAGIMFNRGRWISGAPERQWQYRLVGLYGNETKTINLSFAQETIIPAANSTPEKIISPLETIITKPESNLYRLNDTERIALDSKPTLFTFKITTAPKSAFITVTRATVDLQGKQTNTTLFSKAIPNLKELDFIFHGIGFIAVGCQAEFKIKQPIELVYKSEDILEFEKRIMKKPS